MRGAVLGTFIGRDADVDGIVELIRKGTPVVLVDGDGGVGNSRLALELATRDPRGVRWFFAVDTQRFDPDMVSELDAGDEIVVVIDDAHNRADLLEVVGALERRNPPAQVLLLARPGFRDRIGIATDGLYRGSQAGVVGEQAGRSDTAAQASAIGYGIACKVFRYEETTRCQGLDSHRDGGRPPAVAGDRTNARRRHALSSSRIGPPRGSSPGVRQYAPGTTQFVAPDG